MLNGDRHRTRRSWKAHATAASFLLLVFAVVFGKVFFLGQVFLPPSTSYHELAYNFSLRELAAKSWNDLSLPLWNPTIAFGLPLMEGNASTALSPFYLPYFIHPTPYMLGLTQILHLLLLAFFTHLFLYELTDDLVASCVAGLLASLNGFSLTWSLHGTSYINAVTLLPLLLLTIERYVREPHARRHLILLPVLTGIMFLMALVPSGLFVFAAAWAYALVRLVGRRHDISRHLHPVRAGAYLHLSLAAGVVIGAAQLLPVYQLLALGARGSKHADYFLRAGLNLSELGAMGFNMLMPNFFGVVDRSLNFGNMFLGIGPLEYAFRGASSYYFCYFGILTIPLAAAAFLDWRKNWTFLLFAFLVPLSLLIVGIMPVKQLLDVLTGGKLFNMFLNFALEIFFMAGIPLAVGIGIHDLTSLDHAKLRTYGLTIAAGASVLIASYLALNLVLLMNTSEIAAAYHAFIDRALSAGAVPAGHAPAYYHERFAFFFDEFIRNLPLTNIRTAVPLVSLGLFAAVCIPALRRLLSPHSFAAVILVVVTLDLALFASGLAIASPPQSFLPEFSFIRHLKNDRSMFRISALYSDQYGRDGTHAFKLPPRHEHFDFPSQSDEGSLLSVAREQRAGDYQWYSNLPSHYGLHSILGVDTVVLNDYRKYLAAVENGLLSSLEAGMVFSLFNFDSRLLDLANVKYLLATYDLPPRHHLKKVLADDGLHLYENKNVLPRAYLAEAVIAETDRDTQLALLASGRVDPRSAVLLDKAPAFDPGSLKPMADGPGTVSITAYRNNAVTLDVRAVRPSVVVLLDRFFPGWKVSVDGKEQELLKANYLFRGVAVLPGRHTVEFRYYPSRLFVILTISASVLVVCLVLYFLQCRADSARRSDG